MREKTPPPLFKHQEETLEFLKSRDRALDASDPGTGKTRSQIESFAYKRARGGGRALVIAPKSLLDAAWAEDFKRFAPQLRVTVANATNRDKAFLQAADVYVTNTDAVRWLLKTVKANPRFFDEFDTLIIDEITSFKHASSQRSKALGKIKKYFNKRYGMTGTPSTNAITDIWHPMMILDDGARLGKSFFQFRAAVCTPVQVGPRAEMVKWVDKEGSETAVASLMNDMTIRHVFEECIDIPENFQTEVPYTLVPKQRKAYDAMERDAVLALESGTILSAVNAAGIMGKLLQISSGAAYDENGNAALVDTGRYELVADLVEQRDHSVVFFHWTHQRDQLIAEFEKRGITFTLVDGTSSDKDRRLSVSQFQQGFYRVFLAHPASAAHGLTLTKGNTTIWASPTSNLEHWLQGNRRTYRAGQKRKTETIVITARDTVESKVLTRLNDKDVRQISLLELF